MVLIPRTILRIISYLIPRVTVVAVSTWDKAAEEAIGDIPTGPVKGADKWRKVHRKVRRCKFN
ncbi:hypothetical protein AAMO2058_000432200 [Amorphochlora amoebiformis]